MWVTKMVKTTDIAKTQLISTTWARTKPDLLYYYRLARDLFTYPVIRYRVDPPKPAYLHYDFPPVTAIEWFSPDYKYY